MTGYVEALSMVPGWPFQIMIFATATLLLYKFDRQGRMLASIPLGFILVLSAWLTFDAGIGMVLTVVVWLAVSYKAIAQKLEQGDYE